MRNEREVSSRLIGMMPLEIKLLKFSGCALLAFIIASILLAPLLASGYPVSKANRCLTNLRQQARGLILYSEDSDDRFPRREAWMDATAAYVKSEAILHDIEDAKGGYGYAFNAALSHAKTPQEPEALPLVYDSTNLDRNAFDPFTSLPRPGRHHGKNAVAYADGHVRLRKPEVGKR